MMMMAPQAYAHYAGMQPLSIKCTLCMSFLTHRCLLICETGQGLPTYQYQPLPSQMVLAMNNGSAPANPPTSQPTNTNDPLHMNTSININYYNSHNNNRR
jgi:hypothetical protein